jgi:hypothetical protein
MATKRQSATSGKNDAGTKIDAGYTARVKATLDTEVPKIVPAADATRLAGLQYAQTITVAQQTALQQERARLNVKYGEGSPHVARIDTRLQAVTQAVAQARVHIERAQVKPVEVAPGTAVVFGRVMGADGGGLVGYTVSAVDAKGPVCGHAQTQDGGAFEIAISTVKRPRGKKSAPVPAPEPGDPAQSVTVRLCVAKGGKEVLRDDEKLELATGQAIYRELVVTKSADAPAKVAKVKKK